MSKLLEGSELSAKNEPSQELLEKLQALAGELLAETGGVVLFGVFERDEAPDQWDVLVAADWVGGNVTAATAYVADKIQEKLTPDELVLLAGVVALPSSDPSVRRLVSALRADGSALVENCIFNGILIRRAWIFIANRDSRSEFQPPPYVTTQSAKARIVKPENSRSGPRGGARKRRSRG